MAVCKVCGTDSDGGVTKCAACEAGYHSECWEYNGGCATFGCGSDKKEGAITGSVSSALEVMCAGENKPATDKSNDFTERYVRPVYNDILTLLEFTSTLREPAVDLILENAIHNIIPPPVALKRLEKIKADRIDYFRGRLEERCADDPHFQLVKEDPAYLLKRWNEYQQFFGPKNPAAILDGLIVLDIRPPEISSSIQSEFQQIASTIENVYKSLDYFPFNISEISRKKDSLEGIRSKERGGKPGQCLGVALMTCGSGAVGFGLKLALLGIWPPALINLGIGLVGSVVGIRCYRESKYGTLDSPYYSIKFDLETHQLPKLQILYPTK